MTHTSISCSMLSMSTITKQRLTLFIDPNIVKQSRAQAVVEDLTLTAFVEKALIKYLPKVTIIKKAAVK